MTERTELNRAIEVINEYVSKHAAYLYTFRLEFTRLYRNEAEVTATLIDPDGEDVHVDSEGCWIESACLVSQFDHASDWKSGDEEVTGG